LLRVALSIGLLRFMTEYCPFSDAPKALAS
jgi:hypothetical protein